MKVSRPISSAFCECLFAVKCFPGMPLLRSCIPGYEFADILPDVIFLDADISGLLCRRMQHRLLCLPTLSADLLHKKLCQWILAQLFSL